MLVMLRASARPASGASQFAVRQPHLPDDLRDAQVAVESLLRGGAEGTIHRAAHLAGNAQRAPVRFGYVDRLDALHFVHAQHPLARAVRGSLFGGYLRYRYLGNLRQARAKLLFKSLITAEIRRAAPINPFHQLTCPKRLRIQTLRHERLEFDARQTQEIHAIVAHLICMLP